MLQTERTASTKTQGQELSTLRNREKAGTECDQGGGADSSDDSGGGNGGSWGSCEDSGSMSGGRCRKVWSRQVL